MKNRLKYSLEGLSTLWRSEKSFRIHIMISIFVLLAAFFMNLGIWKIVIILLVIALIVCLEIINSAIERMVDIFAPKTHGLAKEIKDILAGMVLIASIIAAIVGLLVFFAS